MAAIAPWRLAADARRQASIREAHDPFLKSLPPDMRAMHLDRVRNSPLYARIAEISTPISLPQQGTAVLREAMASSSDDETDFHGADRWE
jgi:hypothetical protein